VFSETLFSTVKDADMRPTKKMCAYRFSESTVNRLEFLVARFRRRFALPNLNRTEVLVALVNTAYDHELELIQAEKQERYASKKSPNTSQGDSK